MRAADGTRVDASVVPGRGAATRIAMLTGFTEGWYELMHASARADRVTWDARTLPFLWFYGEFGATDDAPYRDRIYMLALQPFSRNPYPTTPRPARSVMSHHFDYPTDETLDISDAYCFAGPGDRCRPRTVFGMNQDFFSGLEPGPVLDHFPYLALPPPS
jgi:hypothetical protein